MIQTYGVRKIKEKQSKIFADFIEKEAEQEAENNKLKDKVKKRLETSENAQAIIKEKRKELLNELFQHKGITIYAEHSYNSYIPPKNLSVSLDYARHRVTVLLISRNPMNGRK